MPKDSLQNLCSSLTQVDCSNAYAYKVCMAPRQRMYVQYEYSYMLNTEPMQWFVWPLMDLGSGVSAPFWK